ncbi:hypothetical protein [Fuchsiella alkaliacetigena]|nr:hypothetical protein [Fuchsiella alkaliacetigena]
MTDLNVGVSLGFGEVKAEESGEEVSYSGLNPLLGVNFGYAW